MRERGHDKGREGRKAVSILVLGVEDEFLSLRKGVLHVFLGKAKKGVLTCVLEAEKAWQDEEGRLSQSYFLR